MSFWTRPLLAGSALAIALLLSGCGSGVDSAPEGASRPRIAAAFYPLQYVSERVAGALAVVEGLTPPGAEPHELELSARQAAGLSDASLVVYEKGFQPAVDRAVEQASDSGQQHILDVTTLVPLRPLAEQSNALDPHIWLDPSQLATIADGVAAELSRLDPANAETYAANAAQLHDELRGLDQHFRDGLAHCTRRSFVTTHAAFGYLARRYGLEQIAISGLDPEREPSPTRIAEVQREVQARGVTTIFYETLVSPAVAQTIARDLGLRTDVLDPVEGITAESRGGDYRAVMEANLTALRQAGACT